jgi:hypothetical protein
LHRKLFNSKGELAMADRDYVTEKDVVVTNRDAAAAADLDRDRKITDPDRAPDANRDPITGAPGSHPIGTGVGAAAAGAAATWAGAAIGAAISGPAAPIGGAIGAVVGAIAGGLAGKGVAEAMDPTTEDAYWREHHKTRPYFDTAHSYDADYRPAYQYGWENRGRYEGKAFSDVESDLERGWEKAKGKSALAWEKAKHATRDAFDRDRSSDVIVVDHTTPTQSQTVSTGSSAADFTYNPNFADDRYWRDNFAGRPYYEQGMVYEDYEPAYRYASEYRGRYPGRSFDDVEAEMGSGWERFKGKSRLNWEKAKLAARDAWHRVERAIPGDFDRDGR